MWVVQLKEVFLECDDLEVQTDYFVLKGFHWNTSKVPGFLKHKPKEIKLNKEIVMAYFEKADD